MLGAGTYWLTCERSDKRRAKHTALGGSHLMASMCRRVLQAGTQQIHPMVLVQEVDAVEMTRVRRYEMDAGAMPRGEMVRRWDVRGKARCCCVPSFPACLPYLTLPYLTYLTCGVEGV